LILQSVSIKREKPIFSNILMFSYPWCVLLCYRLYGKCQVHQYRTTGRIIRTWPRKGWKAQTLKDKTTRTYLHEHEGGAMGNGLENFDKCRKVNRVKGKENIRVTLQILTRGNKTKQVLNVEGSEVQQGEVK